MMKKILSIALISTILLSAWSINITQIDEIERIRIRNRHKNHIIIKTIIKILNKMKLINLHRITK